MPHRLHAIIDGFDQARVLADLLMRSGEDPDEVFVSEDRKYLHSFLGLKDERTGADFGSLVFTLWVNEKEKHIEIKDLDVVINNEETASLEFLSLMAGSSDSNEYYHVQTGGGAHFIIETVNRHAVEGSVLNTTRDVKLSAFPFELTVYDDIWEVNRAFGFGEGIHVGNTDLVVHGMSETFTMTGGVLGDEKDDTNYSFMLGTVVSFQDVTWKLGEYTLDFIIARARTAAGVMPVVLSRDYFDLEKLKAGSILAMNADIKALMAWKDRQRR